MVSSTHWPSVLPCSLAFRCALRTMLGLILICAVSLTLSFILPCLDTTKKYYFCQYPVLIGAVRRWLTRLVRKKSTPRLEIKDKPFDLSVVWLPFHNLSKLDGLYPISNKNERTIPVLMVCIYNTEQLATDIAKHLKGGTNDSSDSNNKS